MGSKLLPLISNSLNTHKHLTHLATAANMIRMEDHLSPHDIARLNEIYTVFQSSRGDYFPSKDSVCLVEPTDNDTIPQDAIFPISHASEIIEMLKQMLLAKYETINNRKKLSGALSDYLWPSDEGFTQVEFRSSVSEFPPPGQLRVVLRNTRDSVSGRRKRKADGGEYCLAACDDGTVKWLLESECVNQNHVWKVRLFDQRHVGGVLYVRDELQRQEPKLYNNCSINTYITGGNVNGSGIQITGGVAHSATAA